MNASLLEEPIVILYVLDLNSIPLPIFLLLRDPLFLYSKIEKFCWNNFYRILIRSKTNLTRIIIMEVGKGLYFWVENIR